MYSLYDYGSPNKAILKSNGDTLTPLDCVKLLNDLTQTITEREKYSIIKSLLDDERLQEVALYKVNYDNGEYDYRLQLIKPAKDLQHDERHNTTFRIMFEATSKSLHGLFMEANKHMQEMKMKKSYTANEVQKLLDEAFCLGKQQSECETHCSDFCSSEEQENQARIEMQEKLERFTRDTGFSIK